MDKKWSRRQVLARVSVGGVVAAAGLGAAGVATGEQRHMHAALDSLRSAHRELRDADDDKGGHREKAMELVRDAIDQVERGIRYDRRH
jgi:hypothetical protein